MKKLLLITIASFFGAILQTHAQTVEECATGIIHERLMENDSEYANTIAKNNALIKLITETQTRGTNAPILEIPVVVHLVHTGQTEGSGANISMTQINFDIIVCRVIFYTAISGRFNNFGNGIVPEQLVVALVAGVHVQVIF